MEKRFIPKRLMLIFLLAAACVIGGGSWFYHAQEQRLLQKSEETLMAVAQLKLDEIVHWRALHLKNAALVVDNPYFLDAAAQIIRRPGPGNVDPKLLRLEHLLERQGYRDIFLVDNDGQIRRRLKKGPNRLSPALLAALEEAQRRESPLLTNLHRENPADTPHLHVVAPLSRWEEVQRQSFGALILRIDADDFLYRLLQSHPSSSLSSETLLVSREGDSVLFLNELRHRAGTALKLRIPLTQREVPAVMAVLGKEGIVGGRDYRGVPVLSVLKAVPDSPWFMIAKVDQAEVFSQWRFSAWLIIALIIGILAGLAAIVGLLWQRNEKGHYRDRLLKEEGHRITLMSIGDGVIATDREGRITMLNPVAETLTGWTQADARGKAVEEVFRIVNEETRLAVENPIRRVLQEGTIVGLANHTLLIARDGQERPIADSGAPIREAGGAITGTVLVFRDQTEERAARKRLDESEAWFRTTFYSIGDGVITTDAKGCVLQMNPVAESLTGWREAEAKGRPVGEIFTIVNEETRASVENPVHRVLEKGVIVGLANHTLLIARDGRERPIADAGSPIRDEEARIVGVALIFRDQTKERQAEADLRRSEERFRMTFQTSPDAININRLEDGMYEDINEGFTQLTGYTREETVGRTSLEQDIWCNPADREELVRGLKETGYYRRLRADFRCKDGSVKTAVMAARIIKFGEVPHIISITRDITEHLRDEERQRNLEERLQRAEKMEALGVLAGGVAHDLNNVLGILVGYSELLLSDIDPDSRTYGYTQNIMNSGERAAAIVQDLLTLARRGIHAKTTLDLNRIITDQLNTPECQKLSSLHPAVAVTTVLEPELLPVLGSDVHLGKILMNLLFNAVEAIPDAGAVTIETHNRYLDRPVPGYDEVQEGDYVVLSVSDTGEGIPAKDLKRIFEPFYTKKVMGRSGTGLGLAVVWGAVKDHQGYIHVQSGEGQGTTMSLYFPASREEMAQDLPVDPSEYMGSGEAILVVDDILEQRELAVSMLERLNYRVDAVASGEEALAYLREKPADIVVLDMIMEPGMDGLETYQGMLEIRPGQKAVIVSGFAETERVHRARELGAGPYVRKPYIRERIGMAIRGELDRR
ncbi:MAG: PAS domain S-box protein [Deltaproteobacteria bacterium]|nr:PAS domain S-box protein [Deltaproteobacteria bacterium]